MQKIKRFNMLKKPVQCPWYLRPIVYALAYPPLWKCGLKIDKINMEGLKPPYLLLSNHHSMMDFRVLTKAIAPHRANYVVAVDAFNQYPEWLLRRVGCFPKRKFTNDLILIKNMKYVVKDLQSILVVYPEARYSLDGSSSIVPDSLGKVIKFLKVPVVTLNMRGTYLTCPQWSKINSKIPLEATMKQVFTVDQIEQTSIEDINAAIRQELSYDDFKYQFDRQIAIKSKKRAYNLHKLLFICPHCLTESKMIGFGNTLKCDHCRHLWEVNQYYQLKAVEGETYFEHIPDWFEWQRQQIRQQIEDGTYYFEDQVRVETLPNSKKFYKHGQGTLVHDLSGFHLKAKLYGQEEEQLIEWTPSQNYGVHIEYDFRKRGDVIDLSVADDSYWLYPITKENVITKISIATEELYIYHRKNSK